MDLELLASDGSGFAAVYAVATTLDGSQYVNAATVALEPYNAAHWTAYAIPLPLSGTVYGANFPGVQSAEYLVSLYGQAASTPATTDTLLAQGSGTYGINSYSTGTATDFASMLAADAAIFVSDFAQTITYKSFDNTNTLLSTTSFQAIVTYNPPELVTEDGHVLTDLIQVSFANGSGGLTTVYPQRDKITIPARFGGSTKDHLVVRVLSGDAGVWKIRCR